MNPFDDDIPIGPIVKSKSALVGKNPFDGDDDDADVGFGNDIRGTGTTPAANKVSTNPFDFENHDQNNMTVSEGDEETFEEGNLDMPPAGAPVEASWQYLGDLPYRRVPIYANVRWGNTVTENNYNNNESSNNNNAPSSLTAAAAAGTSKAASMSNNNHDDILNHGLSAFPKAALQRHPDMLNPREVRELLNSTTMTKVVGCPYGGPIAAVTLPIVGETTWFIQTEIRIMTNAGKSLAKIQFPPPGALERKYTPADIIAFGFTSRTSLIVVLRDSVCMTWDLKGDPILPPFPILTGGGGTGADLSHATVFEGGAAVLSSSGYSAIMELLDESDDPSYIASAHIAARRILPASVLSSSAFSGGKGDTMPPYCGLVTHLPTAPFANKNHYAFVAIAVLPRTKTASRHPEVFLSTNDNSVVVVDVATTEMKDLNCRARISAPIVDMSFAPNGRFLACFTESSMLTVISTTFETKVLDFDTSEGSSLPPLEMKWCGEDSVVLHWKNLGVLMVGPYGDWLRFPYENTGNLYLIPEADCCRVITDSFVEILQRVPPATALLLRIGSIEPSAMLLDAADAFDNGSSGYDEAAGAIMKAGTLSDAIEGCIEAAAKEFDIATQKRLLRAASFGMHFIFKDSKAERTVMGGPFDDSDESITTMPSPTAKRFVSTARKLRILNALRNPAVGFVLTSSQYDAITPMGVIARLIAMQRPALATEISKYMSMPKPVQLFARASKAAALVTADKTMSDLELSQAAIRVIQEEVPEAVAKNSSSFINRGGFAAVALAANRAGKTGVANYLLMQESSVADKVPALIATGSYVDAMAVATTARDAEFIFMTLMEYQKACYAANPEESRAKQTFQTTLVSKFTQEGLHTMRRYLGTLPDVVNVVGLMLKAQKYTDAGIMVARRAFGKKTDSREKQATLVEASRLFGAGKESGFHKSCTDDYLELFRDQEVLRTKYGSMDVAPESSSVTSTIMSVLKFAAVSQREQHRLLADADKVAKKFRVPEKMLWHAKVKAFAESGQWSNLRLLADSKTKPPIGFKPFARAAIKGNQTVVEKLHYIEKVTSPEERYGLFCEAALWKKALEEAYRMRDGRRIIEVKSRCNNSDSQGQADQYLSRLT